MMRLDLATAEYIGARAQQQDTAAAMPIDAGAMLVLADGLGGHESGADASRIVVDTFRDAGSKGRFDKSETRRQALRDALERANTRIGEGVDPAHGHRGMASTVVAAVVALGELSWVSVGDSHLYVWRKGQLLKLNEDHSQAGIMIRSGQYKPGDPEVQAVKSVLVSALTGRKLDIVDLPQTTFRVEVDDVLILASDGLNTLDDAEIEQIVSEQRPQGAVRLSTVLLETVRGRRAPRQDNTTVAVARVLALPVRADVASNGHGRIGSVAHEVSVPLLLENEARTERIVPTPLARPPAEPPMPMEPPTEPEVEATPAAVSPPALPDALDRLAEREASARAGMGRKGLSKDEPDGVNGGHAKAPVMADSQPVAPAAPSQQPSLPHRSEAVPAAQPAPTPTPRPVAAKQPSLRGEGVAAPLRGDVPGSQLGTAVQAASDGLAAGFQPPPTPRPRPPEADDAKSAGSEPSSAGRKLLAILVIVLLASSIAAGAVAYLRPDWLQGLLPDRAAIDRPPVKDVISPPPVTAPAGEPTSVKAKQPASSPPPSTLEVRPRPAQTEPAKVDSGAKSTPTVGDSAPAREGGAVEDRAIAPSSGGLAPLSGAGTGAAPVAGPAQTSPPSSGGVAPAAPAPAGPGPVEPKLVEEPRPAPAPSSQPATGSKAARPPQPRP